MFRAGNSRVVPFRQRRATCAGCKDYQRLAEILNRARRGGLIPFEALRDDGITRSGDHDASGVHIFSSLAEDVLAEIVRGAIFERLDVDNYSARLAEENALRAELALRLNFEAVE